MKVVNKIISVFNVIILTLYFIMSPIPVFANDTVEIGRITSDSLFVRSGPSTTNSINTTLYLGDSFVVLEIGSNGNGCEDPWLSIEYNGNARGYVCSTYVDVTKVTLGEFDTRFPESYRYKLAILKALHPNWTFTPLNTNLDWDYVVNAENSLGKSLIWCSNNPTENNYDGWKSLDSYNYINNTFINDYPGGGPNWYAANAEVIGYYLDPRNFLNEKNIFMFETLSFNPEYHTLEGVNSMLASTFMNGIANKTEEDAKNGFTYAQIFMEAANIHKVSPYFLVARVIQEVESTRSTIVSGTVPGYEGYYNFYNIGATGKKELIITNGLNRAKAEGWNSEYDAIIGGAGFISNSYIKANQDTNYTQKWDIIGPEYFNHQYMQNIQAPTTESSRIFYKYRDNNLLNRDLVFSIPIYNNMPVSTALPHSGNPNNYLKSVSINNMSIVGFNPENLEYTINIPKNINTLSVSAYPYVSLATVSGVGEINLPNETNVIEISVKAQNEKIRTYKLNIIKLNEETFNINYIMNNSGIKYDDNYIKEIKPNTSVNTIVDAIRKQNLNTIVTVRDANNIEKNNQNLVTGDTITVTINYETKKYSVVIYGDVAGNGNVSIIGLLRVQKILLNQSTLSKVYEEAADVDRDGKVTIIDLLRIQKHILGEFSIY